MAKCTLCGGDLDQNKRCTFCGLDNTKNDDMYKHLVNQNHCSDQPLTHVHTEPKRTYRATTPTQPAKSKSGLGKILGIIAVIVTLGSSVFELIENVVVDDYEYSYSEDIQHDPYAYAGYDLPETGMEYSVNLEPGIYTVGVHIPEGTYVAEVTSGEYGMVTINDSNNSIYLYENIGLLDEKQSASDLGLYEGGHFEVSTGIVITLSAENVQTLELYTRANELTEAMEVRGTMIAGSDFPEGVYDICYEPTTEGVTEFGVVEFCIPMEDYDYILSVEFGDLDCAEVYHNVVLPKGAEITSNELSNITLVPSEEITTTDINKFYYTYL